MVVQGREVATGPQGSFLFELGHDLPRDVGIDLGDRGGDALLKLSHDLEISQCAGDVELQAQLPADFGSQFEDRSCNLARSVPGCWA